MILRKEQEKESYNNPFDLILKFFFEDNFRNFFVEKKRCTWRIQYSLCLVKKSKCYLTISIINTKKKKKKKIAEKLVIQFQTNVLYYLVYTCYSLPSINLNNQTKKCQIIDRVWTFFILFSSLIRRDTRPEPAIRCSTLRGATRLPSAPDHRSEARLRTDPKVLVFVETLYSMLGKNIAELLVSNRIKWVFYNTLSLGDAKSFITQC